MSEALKRSGSPALRASALACFVALGAFAAAWGQEGDTPRQGAGTPELFFAAGLGLESETGRPGALVARELLSASAGRFSGSADVSSALGIVEGTEGSLVDSAGLHAAYLFGRTKRAAFFFDTFLRYRFLFSYAWELRFGGTVIDRWGAGLGQSGLFGDWALGFEDIRTTIEALPAPLWEGDPLLRLSVGWRFSSRWLARATLESFSDEDTTYFFRTLFELAVGLDLPDLSLGARLMLKYSDFFTPTGYLDGAAFRLGVTLPLKRG